MTKRNRLYLFFAAFFAVTFVLPAPLAGQNIGGYEIRSVSVSSGENPITSGLSASVRLAPLSNSMFMEFTAQAEQAWFMLGPRWNGATNVVLTGNIAYFRSSPWTGLYITLDIPLGSVMGVPITVGTLQWPGWFPLWKPDGWEKANASIGYYGDIHTRIGPLGLSYSLQKFLDEPQNLLPGANWTMEARNDLFISASATWNSNSERWMLWMGATWLVR